MNKYMGFLFCYFGVKMIINASVKAYGLNILKGQKSCSKISKLNFHSSTLPVHVQAHPMTLEDSEEPTQSLIWSMWHTVLRSKELLTIQSF